jgi:hypothetical protein
MGDDQTDQVLFSRLRRFVAAAATAKPLDDRRRLLALEADLRSVRDGLNARCGLLVQKMNATGRQINAVSAYARCATLRRDQPHSSK